MKQMYRLHNKQIKLSKIKIKKSNPFVHDYITVV